MKPSSKHFDKIDVTSRLINMVLDMSIKNQINLLKQLDKSNFEGTRKHTRKPYVFVVDCDTDDMFFQEYIRDISGGGIFLRSEQPFSVGQEIKMTFQLPSHDQVFNILGKVVRSCKDGVGIQFIRHVALDENLLQMEARAASNG
ncbi:MAG: PilZ domain-containing protein [Proteobacteria bacterium]|nr:PilZ domain-containing protein [Pseudomonadota bacterium]